MESVIIDVGKLVKELEAKTAEIDVCVGQIGEAKEAKDEQKMKDAEANLDVLKGELAELEKKVDLARDQKRRKELLEQTRALAAPQTPPAQPDGKDMGVPAAPASPRDHKTEEKVKRDAFMQYMRTGKVEGQKRELIQPKSKTLIAQGKEGAPVVAIPRSLIAAMCGPRVAGALGIPVGKAMLATLNLVSNPSRTDLTLDDEYIAQLQRLPFAEPVWLPRVTILPTSSGTTTTFPSLSQSDTATGTGEFGGVSLTWINEAAEKPESEPTFDQISITAYEIAAYTEVSQRALNRSEIALEAFLRAVFAAAFEYEMDRVILNGTGAGQPLGIIPAAGVRTVARAAAGAVSWADFVALKHVVRSYHRAGARFILHDAVEQATENTLDGDGRPLYNASTGTGPRDQINGIPYDVSYNCPTLGTAGDTVYGNPAWYTLTMEEEFGIARSEHYRFRHDLVAFRMYAVVGGRPMQPRAFSILGDADS